MPFRGTLRPFSSFGHLSVHRQMRTMQTWHILTAAASLLLNTLNGNDFFLGATITNEIRHRQFNRVSSAFSDTHKVTPNHKPTNERYSRQSNETGGMPSFEFYIFIALAKLSQCVARARRVPELCQIVAFLHSTPYRYINAWLRFQI